MPQTGPAHRWSEVARQRHLLHQHRLRLDRSASDDISGGTDDPAHPVRRCHDHRAPRLGGAGPRDGELLLGLVCADEGGVAGLDDHHLRSVAHLGHHDVVVGDVEADGVGHADPVDDQGLGPGPRDHVARDPLEAGRQSLQDRAEGDVLAERHGMVLGVARRSGTLEVPHDPLVEDLVRGGPVGECSHEHRHADRADRLLDRGSRHVIGDGIDRGRVLGPDDQIGPGQLTLSDPCREIGGRDHVVACDLTMVAADVVAGSWHAPLDDGNRPRPLLLDDERDGKRRQADRHGRAAQAGSESTRTPRQTGPERSQRDEHEPGAGHADVGQEADPRGVDSGVAQSPPGKTTEGPLTTDDLDGGPQARHPQRTTRQSHDDASAECEQHGPGRLRQSQPAPGAEGDRVHEPPEQDRKEHGAEAGPEEGSLSPRRTVEQPDQHAEGHERAPAGPGQHAAPGQERSSEPGSCGRSPHSDWSRAHGHGILHLGQRSMNRLLRSIVSARGKQGSGHEAAR